MTTPASLTQSNLELVDREFREGRRHLSAPPTRFYLNLTERCSLRCRHCITQAPERTRDRTARDMLEDVVDALRPHLRHAAYVGFPHAGEPLIAPMLEVVLDAVKWARAGEPTAVHLLTNGLALDESRFEQLVKLGVNSISVSMDGMSAATHDALRLGSQIDKLLPRLESLARLRQHAFPHVRLGVAWTLTRSNRGEVDLLLDWAVRAGLDWVKLEEVYPVNPDGEREAQMPAQEVLATLQRAQQRADSLGLKLLEHVLDKQVWKCRLEEQPELRRFSLLDDFANRMEINGCRLPYELVCVEPDGEVKPMSFHHPVAGNLREQDLGALWNSSWFVRMREQSVSQRLCRHGAPTCAADGGPQRW